MTTEMRTVVAGIVSIVMLAPAASGARAGGETDAASIVGAWTLNKDLSQLAPERRQGDERRGRGGAGGRRGGGGFGRGGSSGGFSGGGRGAAPDTQRRRTEAVRAIMEAPERLTITRTESLVIVTTGDGRTTRLSPDGKKVKDDSTGIERKSKWDGNKLVSDITGAGPGKITETYLIDQEHGRLNVTVETDNSRAPNRAIIRRVYDRAQ